MFCKIIILVLTIQNIRGYLSLNMETPQMNFWQLNSNVSWGPFLQIKLLTSLITPIKGLIMLWCTKYVHFIHFCEIMLILTLQNIRGNPCFKEDTPRLNFWRLNSNMFMRTIFANKVINFFNDTHNKD